MRNLITYTLCLICSTVWTQSLGPYTINSGGNSHTRDGITTHTSIGEPLNTILTQEGIVLKQGVLQPLKTILPEGDCAKNKGVVFFEDCDDGVLYVFIKMEDGTILDPYYDDINFRHVADQIVNFDFVDATFDTPCSQADKAVIITCIQEDPLPTENILLEEYGFHIFPNPSRNHVSIELNKALVKTADLQIINASGQIVMTKPWKKGNHRLDINISEMAAGSYFIELKIEDKKITKPIFVIE